MECICTPEGVIRKSTLADAGKAEPGVEATLDYMVKLRDDIMTQFPAGKLPPIDKVAQRSKEEPDEVDKGPAKGGKHIYTITYPLGACASNLCSISLDKYDCLIEEIGL